MVLPSVVRLTLMAHPGKLVSTSLPNVGLVNTSPREVYFTVEEMVRAAAELLTLQRKGALSIGVPQDQADSVHDFLHTLAPDIFPKVSRIADITPANDIPPDAEPSGLEETTARGPGLEAYPLDSLLIRTEQRAIIDVLRRIESGNIRLDPDFQRDFLWDDARQSRLVESILMRIPLPVFYLAEDTNGNLVTVDGLQRLATIRRFNGGNLTLRIERSELDGQTCQTINPRLKIRFEDAQLTFYIIDAKVPDHVRLDIFDRVNSGVPLTRQQMRNALYSGHATLLLKQISKSDAFVRATGGSISTDKYSKQMRDREAVNRVLAFMVHGWHKYGARETRGDMDNFLGSALVAVNSMSEIDRNNLRERLIRAMRNNYTVFGRYTFRKHEHPRDRRNPINLAIVEVMGYILGAVETELSTDQAAAVRTTFYSLMRSPNFLTAISDRTTDVDSVNTRFQLAEQAFGDLDL